MKLCNWSLTFYAVSMLIFEFRCAQLHEPEERQCSTGVEYQKSCVYSKVICSYFETSPLWNGKLFGDRDLSNHIQVNKDIDLVNSGRSGQGNCSEIWYTFTDAIGLWVWSKLVQDANGVCGVTIFSDMYELTRKDTSIVENLNNWGTESSRNSRKDGSRCRIILKSDLKYPLCPTRIVNRWVKIWKIRRLFLFNKTQNID